MKQTLSQSSICSHRCSCRHWHPHHDVNHALGGELLSEIWIRAAGLMIMVAATMSSPSLFAQFTGDYQTNVIANVVTNWPGGYIVGWTNSWNVLLIHSNGFLTSGDGELGSAAVSSNNYAEVSGSNAMWSNQWLKVGYYGSGNTLVISNRGAIVTFSCWVGTFETSSNNTFVITGIDSTLHIPGSLVMGLSGDDNSMFVRDGGIAVDREGFVGGLMKAETMCSSFPVPGQRGAILAR